VFPHFIGSEAREGEMRPINSILCERLYVVNISNFTTLVFEGNYLILYDGPHDHMFNRKNVILENQ
jgi:hypothetical protein